MAKQNEDGLQNQEEKFEKGFVGTFPQTNETTGVTVLDSQNKNEIPHFNFDKSIPAPFGHDDLVVPVEDVASNTTEQTSKLFDETHQDKLLAKESVQLKGEDKIKKDLGKKPIHPKGEKGNREGIPLN